MANRQNAVVDTPFVNIVRQSLLTIYYSKSSSYKQTVLTFFFTTPEEMNTTAQECGLNKIKNLATDFFVTMNIVDSMCDEQFEIMRPLYDQMASHESCTGMSNHALLVCKKQ